MFTVVQFLPNTQTIATVNIDGVSHTITRRSLLRYMQRRYKFEAGYCQKYRDYLLFFLNWASNQGGIVAVWDCKTKRWAHVSNGDYGLIFIPLPEIGKLLTAYEISNFVVKSHLSFGVTSFGVKDESEEGNEITFQFTMLETDQLPFNPYLEGAIEGVILPKDWFGKDYYEKFGPCGFWNCQSEKLIFHYEGRIAVVSFEEIKRLCKNSGALT